MVTNTWLLLIYKVAPEPAKKRVALWRKLKAMGAVYLQNGVCLLPKTEEHLRSLKVLENDICDMQGEAVLLETVALNRAQEDKVVSRFKADRDEDYTEFLDKCADFDAEIAKEVTAKHFTYAELEENDEDLKKLRNWLEKIKKLDFHGAPLRAQAEAQLAHCEKLLDAYAHQVFEAQDENRPVGSGEKDH
jgi:CRISPR/Cas system-associated endoribonuclease Cas2